MGVLYLFNFLDRLNVGFAALSMNRDLGFSPTVFGFGGGALFAGYLLFQVPGSVMFARFGTRRCIFTIMIVWGLLSAGCAFIQGPVSFYVLRFLLGAAEAAFFPGMMFYLTQWFPKAYRVRYAAFFVSAVAYSGIIGGPLSGLILRMPAAFLACATGNGCSCWKACRYFFWRLLLSDCSQTV